MTTPLQEIEEQLLSEKGIRLFLKRDDLIHPHISGNKYRKLKYNLEEARKQGRKTVLTFGGAFSNHIYAVAAAGKEFGFETIGLIRGENNVPLNPTLSFALECGMQLHFITRDAYRDKENPEYLARLHRQYGDFYLLPEGGTNALGVKGCAEIVSEISKAYDFLCCPCGTGGTLAGLIAGDAGKNTLLGFSVLKGLKDLEGRIEELIRDYSGRDYANWSVNHDYHFGGYAKVNETLFSFINSFNDQHHILLDPIYTGKMMFGIYDLIRNNYFKSGSAIVAIHTGGLQAWEGFKENKKC